MGEQEPIQDIEVEAGKESEPGLELAKSEELKGIVDSINDLAEKVERDEKVTAGDVLKLDEVLGHMKVDFYGEEMTIDDIGKIPDLKHNKKVWDKIKGGVIIWHEKDTLTYILPEIAMLIVKDAVKSRDRGIVLYDLRFMSDTVAEILSQFEGGINLNSLQMISDRQAELLGSRSNGGLINLEGLEDISEKGLEFLAENKGSVFLPIKMRDRFKKYRGKKV